jgi:hypothetical protein
LFLGDPAAATPWVGIAKKLARACYNLKIVSKVYQLGSNVKIRVENIFPLAGQLNGICKVWIEAENVLTRRFVYSQRNNAYPFGFFYSYNSIIKKETPWLLERIEELPLVDPDDLPQIQKDTPERFFTELAYKVPPKQDEYVIKNGRDYFNVGNQFYIASNKKVYSFWHTERGDFPAPILFQTSSEVHLEGKTADLAVYNPYLLYDNELKLCYGFAYAHPNGDGSTSRRVLSPVVYCNKEVAIGFPILYGYVCGVGFYEESILTVIASGGFLIVLYKNSELAFVLESINQVYGLVDIPANFVWKFSESGKRFAGLYYEFREIEGQGITKFRGIVLKEYEIMIDGEGTWSLETLRDEFFVGNDEQTNELNGDTRTFVSTVTSNVPIAVYYVGEELRFVNMESTIEYKVIASNITTGTPSTLDSYNIPLVYIMYLPHPPPEGSKTSGVFAFQTVLHRYGGTEIDLEYEITDNIKVDIVFNEDEYRFTLTDYSSTGIGNSEERNWYDNYDYYNQGFFLRGRAYYNSHNTYTDESSFSANGYIGQIRYLNAAMKTAAYITAEHTHNVEYDSENFFYKRLNTDFVDDEGGRIDGDYYQNMTQTENGYTSASDSITAKLHLLTEGTDRVIASEQIANLSDFDSQTTVFGADPASPSKNVNDYVFVYKNAPEHNKPARVFLPDDAYYASAGIFGSYSCCFDWEETHLATKADPNPATRTSIWMYQEDSFSDMQSAKASYCNVKGQTIDTVALLAFSTSFSGVTFRISDPDIYPIRWSK